MCNGVTPALEDDQDSSKFVQIDMMVQGQLWAQPHSPHQCDGVPQDEEEQHHRVKVEAHP